MLNYSQTMDAYELGLTSRELYLDTMDEGVITDVEAGLSYHRVIDGDSLLALTLLKDQLYHAGLVIVDPPEFSTYSKGTRQDWVTFIRNRLLLAWDVLDNGGYVVALNDIDDFTYMKVLLEDCLVNKGLGSVVTRIIKQNKKIMVLTIAQKGERYTEDEEQKIIVTQGGCLVDVRDKLPAYRNLTKPIITGGILNYLEMMGYDEITGQSNIYYVEPFYLPEDVQAKLKDGEVLNYTGRNRDRLIMKIGDEVYELKDGVGLTGEVLDDNYTYLFDIISSDRFDFIEGKKAKQLMKDIIKMVGKNGYRVLDIFAGSGTTGHALLELNNEDGTSRECVLIDNNNVQDVILPRLNYLKEQGMSANIILQSVKVSQTSRIAQ